MSQRVRIEKPRPQQSAEQQQMVYEEQQSQADAQDALREQAANRLGVASAEAASTIAFLERMLGACSLTEQAQAA